MKIRLIVLLIFTHPQQFLHQHFNATCSIVIPYTGAKAISFAGKLAPGSNYKIYLSPVFIKTEAEFMQLKSDMVRIADVNTFRNFIVPIPENINPATFNSIFIWCEAFEQFITAARYR